jgi:hypothetical protein
MDPTTGIVAPQLALDGFKLGKVAIESFIGRADVANLLKDVATALRQDSRVPDEKRYPLANSVSDLRV